MVHMVVWTGLLHLAHWVHVTDRVHVVDGVDLVELLQRVAVVDACLHCCRGGGSGGDMLLVAATRIGIVVDAGMASQFIGTAESLGAARELAGVRLLASVRSDMASLVFEAVKGLVAQRALVWAREV